MRPWSIEECEAYAQQLRDKSRASTAEYAAQAIEYLLGLVRRDWQGLTEEEKLVIRRLPWETPADLIANTEDKLREKNASLDTKKYVNQIECQRCGRIIV